MRDDKLLHGIPSTHDLARMYYELARLGARTVGKKCAWRYNASSPETLLALAADMSRYDPRLFEALTQLLGRSWRQFSPLRVRDLFPRLQSPQVFGVIGAFVHHLDDSAECRYYFEYLTRGLVPVPQQLFYHHLHAPGFPRALRSATETVAEFAKWGFLSEQGPVLTQANKGVAGTYTPAARHNILRRLLTARPTMQLREYLAAVQHSISRQQAVTDLKSFPGLRVRGHGRSARWVAKVQ